MLNGKVSLSFTVENQSSSAGTASSWFDGVYLSTSSTYSNSAQYLGSFADVNSLAALASYTQNVSVTIPNVTPGTNYYLIFYADSSHQVAESNENNNYIAVPITLTAPNVNLQVVPGSLTAPASAAIGGAISVGWSVQNSGSDAAAGNWNDSVYISANSTFDSSATQIGGVSAPNGSPTLAGNASYNQSTNVYIPSNLAAGTYYLYVVTDANQGQSETNTADDTSAGLAITVTAPNLQVTSVQVTPTSAVNGGSVQVSWTVTNAGTGTAAGYWDDAIYLSSNPTLTGTYQNLGTFYENQTLAAAGNYSDTESVNLSGNIPLGQAYIVVVANTYRTLSESSYNDNSGDTPLTLSAPDLTVTTASAPPSATVGSTVGVSWTVLNQGTVEAPVIGKTLSIFRPTMCSTRTLNSFRHLRLPPRRWPPMPVIRRTKTFKCQRISVAGDTYYS